MAIVSIASAKGGCGKTTLAILLGTELAQENYQVRLLDADVNQHASAFGRKSDIASFEVVGDITESNVLAELRKAEAEADIVIIDLPGGSSTLALKALQRSNYVLIPTQASLPDVRDAMKTVAQVDDAQDLARAEIHRALVWTRLLPGFESRAARHVRESVEGKGVPVFKAAVTERAAYRELHISGQVPRQTDPKGSAAANSAAIASELLDNLAKLAEAANG